MSLKKRIFNFFMAFALMFGSTPFVFQNASAEEEAPKPEANKTIEDNGDGTYDITLSVTGKATSSTQANKANVVVVLDTSGSMDYCKDTGAAPGWGQTCETRLDVAKSATRTLGQELLKNNSTDVPDMVQVAYIDFSTVVNSQKTHTTPTTNLSTFNSWVNQASADGGTNWEAALKAANDVNFGDNDDTYIIFVSDGNPTFRLTSHRGLRYYSTWGGTQSEEVNNPDEYYWNGTWHNQRSGNAGDGHRGTGSSDYYGWNLSDAQTQAQTILNSGKKLYAIGAFGDADKMTSLGGDYISADNEDALKAAFEKVVSQITNSLSLTGIKFTDGITGMTSTAVDGNAGAFRYKLDGETWADAPEAKFEDGNVVWDLGNYALKDGETATVTFTVWPSQEALDLIADLNNGKIGYDELTADQKLSIVQNGDTYTLKTNTDFPELTYQVVTTTTENGQTISDPETITMKNPDPVALLSEKLTLEKVWQDSLDQSQREEEVKDVKFDLSMDGEAYFTDLTLNEENNWQLENKIAVAPGIMVLADSEVAQTGDYKEVSYKGIEYAILDEGHDYVFDETNLNSHFELTKYRYHPMLVNGKIMDVDFTKSAEGTVEISAMEALDKLIVENTIKGGINVSKVVVNNDGEEINSEKSFKVKITLLDADDEDYSYDYRIYYGQNNPGYATSGNDHRTDHIYGTGVIEEEIYVGDTIRVVNVDSGVKYKVEEITDGLALGYELDNVQYQVSKGTAENYQDYTDDEKDGEYYLVLGNAAGKAIITNKYKTSSLKVSKEVINAENAKTEEFGFTLNLYSDSKKETSISSENYTVKVGEPVSISDIPVGAYYEVEEKDYSEQGFTKTEYNQSEGTIVAGDENEAKIINTYETKPADVQFKVRKLFTDGFNSSIAKPKFEFELKPTNDAAKKVFESSETKSLTDFTTLAEFSNLEFKETGEYTFELSEKNNGLGGYTYDSKVHQITVTVSDNGYGQLIASVSGVENEKNNGFVVEFTNTYEAQGSLKIEVTKKFEGKDWTNEKFALTLNGEEKEVSAENPTATWTFDYVYNSKNKDTLKAYSFTISEKNESNNITPDSDINFTVNVEDAGDGTLKFVKDNSEIKAENGVAVVEEEFKNTYKPNDASVTIPVCKVVKNNSNSESLAKKTFRFELEGEDKTTEIAVEEFEKEVCGEIVLNYSYADFLESEEYNYTLYEVGGEDETIEYDRAEYEVKVKLAYDREAGELSAELENGKKFSFTNVYTAKPTTVAGFEVEKKISGKTNSDREFSFTLEAVSESAKEVLAQSESKTITSEGTTKFSDLEFEKAGTYEFKLSEDGIAYPGYTNDETEYNIIVTVKDNDGQLEAEVSGVPEDGIKFINLYEVEPTSFSFKVTKVLEGDIAQEDAEMFQFELRDENDELLETVEIQGSGEAEFAAIEKTEVGTYTYTIREIDNGTENYEYDETVYQIVIDVTDEDGKLTYTETITILEDEKTSAIEEDFSLVEDDKAVEEIIFTNRYNEPGKGGVEEEETEANPYTRDNVSLFVSLYILSLVGLMGSVIYAKKRA